MNNLEEDITQMLQGDYLYEERMMLEGTFQDGKKDVALNDIVVSRRGDDLRIIYFKLFVNGELLNSYEADGIITVSYTHLDVYKRQDLRAPTPSAAAELAVWDYRQVENYLAECRLRMNRSVAGAVRMNRLRLKEMETRLSYLHPRHKLQEQQQRLAELEEMCIRDSVKGIQKRKYGICK